MPNALARPTRLGSNGAGEAIALGDSMNQSGGARARLLAQLGALPPSDVIQPKLPVAEAVDDARELSEVTGRSAVRTKLLEVGLSVEILDALGDAIGALNEFEHERLVERNAWKSRGAAVLEQRALWLREEMLAACKFNLRDLAPAGAFERITNSEDEADLIYDLRELSQLVSENLAAFDDNLSFDARVLAAEATSLLGGLGAYSNLNEAALHQRFVLGSRSHAREWRDRAYTHLVNLTTEIRMAGAYAFRGDIGMRRLFVSACPAPTAVTLRTAIRALAG